MQVQGSWVYIDSPNGQIKVHKDLKTYLKFSVMLSPDVKLSDMIDTAYRDYDVERVRDKIAEDMFAKTRFTILPLLAEHGVYDLTADDFVSSNPGLHDVFEAANDVLSYKANITNAYSSWADKEKSKAEARANASITGPGYGIITNDFLAYSVYAGHAKAVTDRQTGIARAQYGYEANKIDFEASKSISHDVGGKINTSFKPRVREAMAVAYNFMVIKLCQGLSSVGQFDMTCLNAIDTKRSESILDNLPFVSQKESVICQALQLCPYNLTAFMRAYEKGFLLRAYFKDLMVTLDFTDAMCYMVESYGIHTAEKMSQAYADNKKVIFTLSGLKNMAIKDTAREVLMCDFQRLLTIYAGVGGYIKNQVPLADFLSKQYPDADVADYWAYLSNDLATESSRFTPDEISFCASECNIGVWESLAQWYGRGFHSFGEIFNLVQSTWEQQTATALANEREQKIEALEKELAQLKPKPVTPDDSSTFWAIIGILLFFVLPPIIGIIGFITFGDEENVLLNLFLLCSPLIWYVAAKLQPTNPKQLRIEQIEQELSKLKNNEQ